MSERRNLYPPIEPYETGMLDVGNGHRVCFEREGKPGGKPAVWGYLTPYPQIRLPPCTLRATQAALSAHG